jgi:hypothetical protein
MSRENRKNYYESYAADGLINETLIKKVEVLQVENWLTIIKSLQIFSKIVSMIFVCFAGSLGLPGHQICPTTWARSGRGPLQCMFPAIFAPGLKNLWRRETQTRRELSCDEAISTLAIWGWTNRPTNQPTDKVIYRGAMLAPKNKK